MSSALILVENTDGNNENILLDLAGTLTATRKQLTAADFMSSSDQFLLNSAPIAAIDEDKVTLSQVVGEQGQNPLHIGVVNNGLPVPGDAVARYNQLDSTQQLALFANLQIYRGITASVDQGFTRSFKPCIASWHSTQLPASKQPTYVTQVEVDYSFSEVTHSMTVSSVDKASASLDTPFGGGQASFSYAQQNSTSSKEVKEYLTGKFVVNKIVLDVDIANLQLVADFEQAVLQAVRKGDDLTDIDRYAALVSVLNERGYFVPKRFTLGGELLSTSTTTISEFSEAESEKTEFSAGFKAAIDGFGGGADYSHSQSKATTSSTTNKFSNLNITKKGGLADAIDYASWTKSLNPAINWDVIRYDQLYPTLALLSNKALVRYCISLLESYYTYDTVRDLQSVISIPKYTTAVESMLMDDGSGIG